MSQAAGILNSNVHEFEIWVHLRYVAQTAGWLLLNVGAESGGCQQVVSELLRNNVGGDFSEQTNAHTQTRFHGLTVSEGPVSIVYEALVRREYTKFSEAWDPRELSLVELPPEVAGFLYPSRYCESDRLVRFASKEFGGLSPGHSRVVAVCNWIHDHIDYEPGSTNEHSSALECLISRAGVCRDFAHLGISFCRALGIPARYASAYVHNLPTPDFHAFFEVWLGDRWWYYDATRLAPQTGFILIGTGHDAADLSVATMSSGVSFESMEIHMRMKSDGFIDYTASPISFQNPNLSTQS